ESLAVAKDGAVVNIVTVVGIVTVGRIPPPAVPIPVTASVTHEPIVAVPVPIPIVLHSHIARLCHVIGPLVPGALEMLPLLLRHVGVVLRNVFLFRLVAALNVPRVLIVVATRCRVRILLFRVGVCGLLFLFLLPAGLIACLRPTARCCRRRLRCRLRPFLFLFIGLIVALREQRRCDAYREYDN